MSKLISRVPVRDDETQSLLGEVEISWSVEMRPRGSRQSLQVEVTPIIDPVHAQLDDGARLDLATITPYFSYEADDLVTAERNSLVLVPDVLWVCRKENGPAVGALWFK